MVFMSSTPTFELAVLNVLLFLLLCFCIGLLIVIVYYGCISFDIEVIGSEVM